MADPRLGTGIRFPFVPDGGFATIDGADAVAQALRSVLLTEPGERVGRPGYGAGLSRFLFAPNNVATRAVIQQVVADAIRRDEPRARLHGVDVAPGTGEPTRIDLRIRYTVTGENVPRNLVFPFYLDDRGA